jgi:hypothetical protein
MNDNIVKSIESSPQVARHEESNTTRLSEEDVVDFDGLSDTEDPLNWSGWYKWSIVCLISILSLIV